MENISIQKAKLIRNFIANYQLKPLIRTLKKLKIFSVERGMLNVIKNSEQFLRVNKLRWFSLYDQMHVHTKAIMSILNNIPH